MNSTKFYGGAYTHDSEVVRATLAEWLAVPNLAIRIKIFGDQIFYEGDSVYVFAETGTQAGQLDCLLQGHIVAGSEEAGHRLQQLVDLFKQRGVEASFDYTEVDDAGREISDELRVK